MNLEIFKYEDKTVRTQKLNDEIYFVGKDVAEILGYQEPHKSINRLVDEDDRMKHPVIDVLGRTQEAWMINESGLYSLILSSKLEEAKKFKKWITSEVLPSIRKHGAYMTNETLEKAIYNPDFLIGVLNNLKNEKEAREKLEGELEIKNQLIGELQPAKDYLDCILASEDTMKITQIASDYGLSAKALNKILCEEGIIRKVNQQWILYHKHMNKGYTKSNTFYVREDKTVIETVWTQKGRIFIHNTLKDLGYKANIEKH